MARTRFRSSRSFAELRRGLFRATLLFGSIGAALALIVVPEVDRHATSVYAERGPDLDMTVTGSIAPAGDAQRYVRSLGLADRSDLGPCIMFPNGSHRGAC